MDELKRVKAGAFAQLRSLTMLHMVHNKNLREIDHDAFRELKKHWPIQEVSANIVTSHFTAGFRQREQTPHNSVFLNENTTQES